jgi:putative peptidoglycan lipid II flippase
MPSVRQRPTSLLRTALLLLPLQAVFRAGEALLPLLLAAWFGRTRETDVYYLLAAAFAFASSFVLGALSDSAVVPVLVEVEARARSELPRVAGAMLGHALVAGVVLAAVMGGVAALVALALSDLVALWVTLLLALGVVATSARAFYVAVCHARGRFAAPPIASGLGVGLALATIAGGRHALGVVSIPLGLLAGELLALAVLAAYTSRALGLRVTPNLERPEPLLRALRLVGFEGVGSLLTRINPVLDQLMSRMAGVVGGGTLLVCAANVASLPTAALQATLLPALLTRLSGEAARPDAFRRTTRRTLVAVVAVLAAGAALLAALRLPIARLLFLHGAMDGSGVGRVADILPFALLGVVPFGALLVLVRAHIARQNSRIMPGMGALNAACNAVFNLVFVGWLGLAGIALSTSVTYAIVAVVLWVRLPREARTERDQRRA